MVMVGKLTPKSASGSSLQLTVDQRAYEAHYVIPINGTGIGFVHSLD